MKKVLLLLLLLLTACSPAATPTPTATLVPTSTATAEPTKTHTPVPSATITASPEPTSTPMYGKLLFEEDFKSNKLGWTNKQKFVTGYIDGKLGFDYPKLTDESKKYFGSWTLPEHPLEIKGDAKVQVTFDRPVWFSGIFFLPLKSQKDNFAIIIGCSEDLKNWKSNNVSVGYLKPSDKNAWEGLKDDISASVLKTNGVITFTVEFNGDLMTVYINDELVAKKKDKLFADPKALGITAGNGDQFNVTEIKMWGPE